MTDSEHKRLQRREQAHFQKGYIESFEISKKLYSLADRAIRQLIYIPLETSHYRKWSFLFVFLTVN